MSRIRHIIILIFVMAMIGCSGSARQTKGDKAGDKSANPAPSEGASAGEIPAKEPVEVVYTAKASDESVARIEAAVAKAYEGRISEAKSELESVLSSDDEAFLAAFNLAVLHDQEDGASQARNYYEKALSIEPDFSPALLNLIRLEARSGRDGVSIADRWVAERPENLEHQLARLDALSAAGRYSDVIDGARVVLKRDEANARARYYLGLAHYSEARYPLAGYIVDAAFKIDGQDPEMWFLSGLIQLELDDETRARQAFAGAVELRPDYPEAQNALGLMLYKNRDFADAEAAYRSAIAYAPDFQEAYLNLGNVLKSVDRGDDAESAYNKALELSPGWADAHFSLGALYLAAEVITLSSVTGMARLEKARAELEKAQSGWKDPESTELVVQFIAKADNAIAILKAEQELDTGGGDTGGGGGDPFGDDGGGDPFDDGGGADDGDPFDDGGGADDGDPFDDGGGESGGGGGADDGDPFD